jgi:hypothetical protein
VEKFKEKQSQTPSTEKRATYNYLPNAIMIVKSHFYVH